MLNLPNWREVDLSTIDLRTITSLEWEAVKAEVNRRASVERKAMLRQSMRRLWIWLQPIRRRRAVVVRAAFALRNGPPAHPSAAHRSNRSASPMASRRISSLPGLP
ncbi:MAG: hypothetical protein JWN71_995 [Xanthobacteraceae bacterium]|nr:hypothetical protein [Xanthobacteraceae bacterium]